MRELTLLKLVCTATGERHPVRLWQDYGVVCTTLWPTTGAVTDAAKLIYEAITIGSHTVDIALSGIDLSSQRALEQSLRDAYRAWNQSEVPGEGVSDEIGASMVSLVFRKRDPSIGYIDARGIWERSDPGERAQYARAFDAYLHEPRTPEKVLAEVAQLAFAEADDPSIAIEGIRLLLRPRV